MQKDEALLDFLKALRIIINNASAYTKQHPYFIKSVESFKEKIDPVFNFIDPIKIGVTGDSLFLDDRYWQKETMCSELANFLHIRKIKSIEFRSGVTNQELAEFFSSIALPPREIWRSGGLQNILKDKIGTHLSIENLDYSEFLRFGGEEIRDVWTYLFKEVIDKADLDKINEFADNFESIIKKLKPNDLTEDEGLRENLYQFLLYLKNNQKEKFCKCSGLLLNMLLKSKEALQDEKLDKIRSLFKEMENKDLACLFWDKVLTDEGFDTLTFQLFSRIAGEDKDKAAASSLLSSAPSKETLKRSPGAVKKMQDLLSGSDKEAISEVYRNTLEKLFKEISFEKGIGFDKDAAFRNYRYIILYLFSQETNKKRLELIFAQLLKELNTIEKEMDLKYIKILLDAIKKRDNLDPATSEISKKAYTRVANFIENNILDGKAVDELASLSEGLDKSSLDATDYLKKIFEDRTFSPAALRLFFKFFPVNATAFQMYLAKKYSDIEFMGKIIQGLKMVDCPLSLEILKNIYYPANEFLKIEVLRSMKELPMIDQAFLFEALKSENVRLKKAALAVLAKETLSRRQAIDALLSLASPWGSKNKILLENMGIIDALGLRDANAVLVALSKRKLFWNKDLRQKAQAILRSWNVRTS